MINTHTSPNHSKDINIKMLEGAIRVLEGSEAVGCFGGYFQASGSGGFTGGTEDPDGANEGRLVGFRGLIHMFHDFNFLKG